MGQLPCGLAVDVPAELWAATTLIVDTRSGGLACDVGPLFVGIEVAPAQQVPAAVAA